MHNLDRILEKHYWAILLSLVALIFSLFALMVFLQRDPSNEELSYRLLNPICLFGSLTFALDARVGQLTGTLRTGGQIIERYDGSFWFNFAVGVMYIASAVFLDLAIFL